MTPVTVNTPSTTARAAATDCVQIRSRRLSNRSATTPPSGASSSVGKNWAAMTAPRAEPRPVSSSTSQDNPSSCIHVPLNETSWLKKNSR